MSAGSVENLARDFTKIGRSSPSPRAARFGSGYEANDGASVAGRCDSCEEVASRSRQRDPREYHGNTWRDSSSTRQRRKAFVHHLNRHNRGIMYYPGRIGHGCFTAARNRQRGRSARAGAWNGWRKHRNTRYADLESRPVGGKSTAGDRPSCIIPEGLREQHEGASQYVSKRRKNGGDWQAWQRFGSNCRLTCIQFLSWESHLSWDEEKSVVATFVPALDRTS